MTVCATLGLKHIVIQYFLNDEYYPTRCEERDAGISERAEARTSVDYADDREKDAHACQPIKINNNNIPGAEKYGYARYKTGETDGVDP